MTDNVTELDNTPVSTLGVFHYDEQLVASQSQIMLYVSYPLREPLGFPLRREAGIRVRDLLRAVFDVYARMFNEPERYGVLPGHKLSTLTLQGWKEVSATKFHVIVDDGASSQ